jgi:glyoxylase-like metal-dependent hydrolase (beta-lactamase superfamily II)
MVESLVGLILSGGAQMRDVRKIGRRTWLARVTSGAVAVWTSIRLDGRDGWAVSLGMPAAPSAHAQGPDHGDTHGHADVRRVQLGANGFVSSYIVIRGAEAAIVDTGVAGSAQRIGEVVQEAGLGWDAIRHLIVTHHHGDHAGSVSDVLGSATGATIWAGAPDIPRISSTREITPAEDGSQIFGLRIVATPGHTLGHLSVYDEDTSTFIAGDAINTNGGTLQVSPPQNTADMTLAVESVKKIAALGFERALFMHGDPIESGAAAEIGRLALGLPNDAAMAAHLLQNQDACCHA